MIWRIILFWWVGSSLALADLPLHATSFSVNLPSTVNFQYDANGNLTNDGTRVFYYDAENRLTNVTVTGQYQTTFTYDGLSRRRIMTNYAWQSSAWAATNVTRYVDDGMQVLQERNSNNTPVVTYTRGLDLSASLSGAGGIGGLLARADTNGTTFYHADGGGNITALMDANQLMVARYLYDAFGKLTGMWGTNAAANVYRYSSKEYVANGGIYSFGFRFYEPNFSRWLNRDPIQEAGGKNLYGFVGNNPINRIDPYGLAWYDGIAALTGFGGAGTFSAAWGGFGSSWGDSSQSMWNAFQASNGNELADAYNGGIFDQTQNADAFTYYGTRAAVGTAAAATAAAIAVDAAGLSTRIACHGSHHEFGPLGRLPHVQLNWWQAGVKGSGGALRFPVPPGTPGFPP